MWKFGKGKKGLQVSLTHRKKVTSSVSPLPTLERKKYFKNAKKTATIVFLLIALVLGVSIFSRSLSLLASRVLTHSGFGKLSFTPTPLDAIVNEVGKQYLLPEGETPTLAMITSLDELRGQQFFVKAKVGDAVLMYLAARKAILWRPSTHQVIEVGPINVTEPSTSSSPDAPSIATST